MPILDACRVEATSTLSSNCFFSVLVVFRVDRFAYQQLIGGARARPRARRWRAPPLICPPPMSIVGGGVAGLASALALLRAGRSVRLIEARTLGSGASPRQLRRDAEPRAAAGRAGHGAEGAEVDADAGRAAVRASRFRSRVVALADAFRPALQYARLGAQRPRQARHPRTFPATHPCLGRRTGARLRLPRFRRGLRLPYPETVQHDQQEFPLLRELGVQVEAIDGRAYEAMEPALMPGVVGAIRFRGDSMLRPDRYVDELARNVRALGGQIHESCALSGLQQGSLGWEIEAGGVRFSARNVVVAAGSWSPLLARTRSASDGCAA